MIGHFLPALLLLGTSAAAAAKTCFKDYPCSGPSEQSFPGAWDSNNFSPASRNVAPAQIKDQDHNVLSSWPGPAELSSNGSMLVFDFGKEVGGIVSVGYTACGSGTLGLSFSEASNFTGYTSDESNGGSGPDGALTVAVAPATCGAAGQYTTPEAQQRGGFRYLTLFAMSSGPIDINITSIEVEISFAPTWANLRAYGGYFHSSDEVLNSIWYASTYTVQTNTIPSDDARQYPLLNTGWANNASLGTDSGYSAIVDGAKRDRAIWAGDLGVATRSVLIGTGDQQSIMNALQVQYAYQVSDPAAPAESLILMSGLGIHWRAAHGGTAHQLLRLRHVPHVDHHRDVRLPALQRRHGFPQPELGRVPERHGVCDCQDRQLGDDERDGLEQLGQDGPVQRPHDGRQHAAVQLSDDGGHCRNVAEQRDPGEPVDVSGRDAQGCGELEQLGCC